MEVRTSILNVYVLEISLARLENHFMKMAAFISKILSFFGKRSSFVEDEMSLRRSLQRSIAKGETKAMLTASMKLSRLLLDRGERKEADGLLREATSVASKSQFLEEHAEVRVELANLAKQDGDMTSACEHWQIALQLYHDLNRKEDRDEIAKCMKDCGCPTAWFLNSF